MASLNPVDFKATQRHVAAHGRPAQAPGDHGQGFAERSAPLGADVRGYAVGQRVFGSVAIPWAAGDLRAIVAAFKTDLIAAHPDSLSDDVAASLPVASPPHGLAGAYRHCRAGGGGQLGA